MATIYGDQDPGNLNDIINGSGSGIDDTIYGATGNDEIYGSEVSSSELYGEDGNDTIRGGSSFLYWDNILEEDVYDLTKTNTLNGGNGNDVLSSDSIANFIFDAGFGKDVITGEVQDGSTIQFNFQRPENLRFYRYETTLYIESDEGRLKVENYFNSVDLTSPVQDSPYSISFEDEFGAPTDIISVVDIQDTLLNGSDGDDIVRVQVDSYSSGTITLNGGKGNDWIEISPETYSFPSTPVSRAAIVDGGQGDDVYNLKNDESTIIFARDSGRDFVFDGEGQPLETVTIQTSNTAGSISLSDVYATLENGSFSLRITGSDAAIVIGSQTLLGILADSKEWNVTDGVSSVSVKDLILEIPGIVSGSLAIAGATYDGMLNTQGETVLGTGISEITSGADNESFVGITQSITFAEGFGHDVVSHSARSNIIFEQALIDFSFKRQDRDLLVFDNEGNKVLFKDFFLAGGEYNAGETELHFSTSSVLTWETLATILSANSDAENIFLQSSEDIPTGPVSEAAEQHFYADIGDGVTVNGGSGTNYIHSSMDTVIIHDTANGGTDIVGTNVASSGAASVTILVDDIDNLHFELHGPMGDLVVSNSLTGSSLTLVTGIFQLSIVDGSATTELNRSDIIARIEADNSNYYSGIGTVVGAYESSFQAPSSGTNDVLDMRFNGGADQGSNLVVDGRGGSDTYYGGASNDTFVYDGTGSLVIKGIDNSLWGSFGYDTLDISSASISKSDFLSNISRDGSNLVYNGGEIVIENFFLNISSATSLEGLINPVFSRNVPAGTLHDLSGFLRYFAFAVYGSSLGYDELFDSAHVVDSLQLTDGILRYEEIYDLFPKINFATAYGDVLNADDLGDYIDALASDDIVYGNSSSNILLGNEGDDFIEGFDGNDILDGGRDRDTLVGGDGDDTYVIDDELDVIVELDGEGYDTIQSTISTTLEEHQYIEDLTLLGKDDISGTGNDLENFITGNSGNNTIDGGIGSDIMIGGLGDDTYYVDSATDTVIESEGEGNDTVYVSSDVGTDYLPPEGIENVYIIGSGNLNITGSDSANLIYGNSGSNVISGGIGNDSMTGGDGSDTLIGGAGDDLFYLAPGDTGDVIIEGASEGTDLVLSTFSYTLGDNLESLTLFGGGNIDGTGNAEANSITGNSGNNILTGNNGNDTLDGGFGNDTLVGGQGNDVYILSATGDSITESSGQGTDTVQASYTYTLGSYLENLTLSGSDNIDGTGNADANTLVGNTGNNALTGGASVDTLKGGIGDDTYILTASGDSSDVIIELSGEGTDTVQTAVAHTLASHVENLTQTGSSNISGTGNTLDNVLTGNSGNNSLTGGAGHDTLSGGAGADTLNGGAGNDVYILAASGDTIVETSGNGTDTVLAEYTYTLGTYVENLQLTGSSNIAGTGNGSDNLIIGNSGGNTLSAAGGNDTLKGGGGTDQLLGGTGHDTYVLNRGDGADTITENDSTSGNTDVAVFGESGSTINHDQLWFSMSGSNLEVSVIGTSDKFVINNWSLGSSRYVEQFEASDGYDLTSAQVANLVSAMSSFSPPSSGTFTLDPGTYSTVLTQIAASWTA